MEYTKQVLGGQGKHNHTATKTGNRQKDCWFCQFAFVQFFNYFFQYFCHRCILATKWIFRKFYCILKSFNNRLNNIKTFTQNPLTLTFRIHLHENHLQVPPKPSFSESSEVEAPRPDTQQSPGKVQWTSLPLLSAVWLKLTMCQETCRDWLSAAPSAFWCFIFYA